MAHMIENDAMKGVPSSFRFCMIPPTDIRTSVFHFLVALFKTCFAALSVPFRIFRPLGCATKWFYIREKGSIIRYSLCMHVGFKLHTPFPKP